MRASSLDRVIIIQRATETRDSFNSKIPAWNNLITLRASKQEIRDGERIAAQEVGADITMRFQVRWSSVVSTITPKDRLVFENRTYGILGVKEIGRREGREITATSRID